MDAHVVNQMNGGGACVSIVVVRGCEGEHIVVVRGCEGEHIVVVRGCEGEHL